MLLSFNSMRIMRHGWHKQWESVVPVHLEVHSPLTLLQGSNAFVVFSRYKSDSPLKIIQAKSKYSYEWLTPVKTSCHYSGSCYKTETLINFFHSGFCSECTVDFTAFILHSPCAKLFDALKYWKSNIQYIRIHNHWHNSSEFEFVWCWLLRLTNNW